MQNRVLQRFHDLLLQLVTHALVLPHLRQHVVKKHLSNVLVLSSHNLGNQIDSTLREFEVYIGTVVVVGVEDGVGVALDDPDIEVSIHHDVNGVDLPLGVVFGEEVGSAEEHMADLAVEVREEVVGKPVGGVDESFADEVLG